MTFKEDSPFIEINSSHFEGDLVQYSTDLYNSFKKYILALKEIVTDKLPDILRQAEEFPAAAEEVKDHSTAEFEGLNPLNKGKAVANFGMNMKVLLKIPPFIQGALNNFKEQFTQIKEVIEEVKSNQDRIKAEVTQCHEKKLMNPTECYKEVKGAIQYNKEVRSTWEKKNHGWHKGVHFEPETIPKTDMIGETKK